MNRNKSPVVVIVSGSCCIPGMEVLDSQAGTVVNQAISETGLDAQVKIIPATSAMFGALPRNVMSKLMADFNQSGRVGLPAVLINGEPISFGPPDLETVKSALLQYKETKSSSKEQARE